jgi:Flp pilus assembly pilin Flp
MLTRLLYEDRAGDLIEYALLASFIGVIAVLLFPDILDGIQRAWRGWGTEVDIIWEPNNPL